MNAVRRCSPLLALVAFAAGPAGLKGKNAETVLTAGTDEVLMALGPEGLRKGYERLKHGQFALAVSRFTVELAARPDSTEARRGLALALAGARRCQQALPLLEALRATSTWDAALARAEGSCAARTSEYARSAAAFAEATQLGPHDYEAWYGLVLAEVDLDNAEVPHPELDAALEGLAATAWRSARVPVLVAVSEAWMAYRRNEDPWWALEALRHTLETSRVETRAARVEAETLEGLLWLDLGDPLQADRFFRRGLRDARRAPRIGAWHAEALRRMGDTDAAEAILDHGRASMGEHWAKNIVKARLFTDLGDLTAARAEVAKAPQSAPETIATRWYIARAAGDNDERLKQATLWSESHSPADARLEMLIPWT